MLPDLQVLRLCLRIHLHGLEGAWQSTTTRQAADVGSIRAMNTLRSTEGHCAYGLKQGRILKIGLCQYMFEWRYFPIFFGQTQLHPIIVFGFHQPTVTSLRGQKPVNSHGPRWSLLITLHLGPREICPRTES
jgi:hypothetical protein